MIPFSLSFTFFLLFFLLSISQSFAIVVHGGGASFPELVYEAWNSAYSALRYQEGVKMIYDVTGSGAGQAGILAKQLDYAGSDAVLTEAQYAASGQELQMIPFLAGCVVIVYNLPGVTTQLLLSRQVLADIFLGNIMNWNDTNIQALNPTISFPNVPIQLVVRKDSSGTTEIMTTALSSISPIWNATVGVSTFPNWPWFTYMGYTANGVAGLVGSLDYTLGYIDQDMAIQQGMVYAQIINRAGTVILPSEASIQSAMNDYIGTFTNLSRFSSWIADGPGPNSYPITAFTYLIVYKKTSGNCDIMLELYRYFYWILHDQEATGLAVSNSFAVASPQLKVLIEEVLNEITCDGLPIYSQVLDGLDCDAGEEKVLSDNATSPFEYICGSCVSGTYNLNETGVCYPCPSGGICAGGASVLAQQGYWRNPNVSDTPLFIECLTNRCCPQGGCSLNDSCTQSFIGDLCSNCPDGYYIWSELCLQCNASESAGYVIGTILMTLLVVVVYILIPKYRSNFIIDMLFFYQVAQLLVDVRGSQGEFLGIMNLNLNLLLNGSSVCLLPLLPFQKYMFIFLSPLVLFFDLGLILVLCLFWNWLVPRIKFIESLNNKLPQYLSTRGLYGIFRGGFFDMLMISYMPFIRPALSLFDCQNIGNTYTVVRQEPAIQCGSHQHVIGVVVASLVLFLLVIVLPGVALHISIKRKRLNLLNYHNHTDPYGLLYQQYKDAFYWYLGFDLIERAFLISLSVIFAFDELWYSLALFLGCWALVYPKMFLKIHRDPLDNYLKSVTYMCLVGLALSRTFKYFAGIESPFLVNFFLFFPLILVPVKLYFLVVFLTKSYNSMRKMFEEYRKKHEDSELETPPPQNSESGTLPRHLADLQEMNSRGKEKEKELPRVHSFGMAEMPRTPSDPTLKKGFVALSASNPQINYVEMPPVDYSL